MWDLESSQCIATFEGHTSSIRGVAITPDGRHIISGSSDMTLKVWDLFSGKCITTFKGHAGFLSTSAKTGEGCEELKAAIAKNIPWDRLPWTATRSLFKTL